MEKEEVKVLLAMLKTAYPKTYKGMTVVERRETVAMYYDHFKRYPSTAVRAALDSYIDENEFPPTIAGIKRYLKHIEGATDYEAAYREYWGGICGSVKYEDMSPLNKAYAGSQKALDELGADERTVESVVKGQYMRRIPEIAERLRAEKEAEKRMGADGLKTFRELSSCDGNVRALEESDEEGDDDAEEKN